MHKQTGSLKKQESYCFSSGSVNEAVEMTYKHGRKAIRAQILYDHIDMKINE